MTAKTCISFLLSLVLLLQPLTGNAMETDQYNLSPVPLADIGDEVSEYVENNLRLAVAKINAEITSHRTCIETVGKKGCDSREEEQGKLKYLRSNDAVAKEFYKLVGDGNLFITYFGNWISSHRFQDKPASYKSGYAESIYSLAPIDYVTLSPTVKLFGTEFGSDKLEHIFQQGYKYYKIAENERSKGAGKEQAIAKAVKWGKMTERTYFGMLVSGVYSNADLCANYAGMKFYKGLTNPVTIGNRMKPPILILNNGLWTIDNNSVREYLLKPFLTDHLNEALNPSGYAFTIFPSVRRAVKDHGCPEWKQRYPDLKAHDIAARSEALEKWNGEDYGFTKSKRMVNIADLCF